MSARSRRPTTLDTSMPPSSILASSEASTGVDPLLTKWRGPRTEWAGLVGTTWPVTSQSKSILIATFRPRRLTSSTRYLGHKPSPSHRPIAHDALWGNPQHFCRLLHAEPPEKSEFDDLGFARVDLSQRIQSFVNGDDLAVPGARGDFRYVVQIQLNRTAAPFEHALCASAVHQNPPHHVRGNRKEMRSVLPCDAVHLHQPQKDFVDQGGGL